MKAALRNLLIVVAVPLIASVANAGEGPSHWLNHAAAKKQVQTQPGTAPVNSGKVMHCPECKTATMTVKRDLLDKPGHGQKEVKVAVHQCPNCADVFARKIGTKEVELVHNCHMGTGGSTSCCGTV